MHEELPPPTDPAAPRPVRERTTPHPPAPHATTTAGGRAAPGRDLPPTTLPVPTRAAELRAAAAAAARLAATGGGRAARLAAAGGGRAARTSWRFAGRAGHHGARGARGAVRGVRTATHARGAGESGLARVIELHLVTTLADTLIVTALASTIFFAVPTHQARGRVATSLLITMVPFVLLAPVIGPVLDRVRGGRRYAIATTTVVRAFLAWVMAGAVGGAGDSQAAFSLYPAAFGFLVSQKAYIVTRAAAVPRVLPRTVGLVAANSRISIAGVAAMAIGAPLGAGITATAGPSWTMRLAFVVFAAATVLALALSPQVDSSAGEVAARISSDLEGEQHERPARTDSARADQTRADQTRADQTRADQSRADPARAPRRRSWNTGPQVVLGLRANTAVRAYTGFLTLFLAFRLRDQPLGGLHDTTAVALVVALAAVGGGVGTVLAGSLRRIRPEGMVVAALVLTAVVAAWAALAYGLWPVLAIALVSGLGQGLAKLCLDALIQRDVPEQVRTSAFARSETVLQLAWVGGGAVGLALPLSGAWGLGIAASALTVAAGFVTSTLFVAARHRGARPGGGTPGGGGQSGSRQSGSRQGGGGQGAAFGGGGRTRRPGDDR